ncbi:CidA/LrgA family protein [Castellaniella sp.]|uniref:CidA/LrgA family protein n=1 Tax=Castellaniella sp. TaxID=1955812 RepID=UPI0035643297
MSSQKLRVAGVVRGAGRVAVGLAVLIVLQQAGGLLVGRLALPVPPAIVGMIVLLPLLGYAGHRIQAVQAASFPLLRHMMLFFVPAVTGIMDQIQILRAGWLPFVASCVIGAVLTLAVTALTLEWLIARRQGRGDRAQTPGPQ